jgi:hypothetical protein
MKDRWPLPVALDFLLTLIFKAGSSNAPPAYLTTIPYLTHLTHFTHSPFDQYEKNAALYNFNSNAAMGLYNRLP